MREETEPHRQCLFPQDKCRKEEEGYDEWSDKECVSPSCGFYLCPGQHEQYQADEKDVATEYIHSLPFIYPAHTRDDGPDEWEERVRYARQRNHDHSHAALSVLRKVLRTTGNTIAKKRPESHLR